MANVYGTPEYDKYIEDYRNFLSRYKSIKTEISEEHFELNGIKIDMIVSDNDAYQSEASPYPCAHNSFGKVTITLKNGLTKTYDTVDASCPPQIFSYEGVDHIFMSKALYGYCIIDTRNFEEYNYFPSTVLKDGGEAFICCEAACLNGVLIICGCYWGCPYEYYVLELESKKAIRLNNYADRAPDDCQLTDEPIVLFENGFAFKYEKDEKECFFAYDDLKKWIEKDGSCDF